MGAELTQLLLGQSTLQRETRRALGQRGCREDKGWEDFHAGFWISLEQECRFLCEAPRTVLNSRLSSSWLRLQPIPVWVARTLHVHTYEHTHAHAHTDAPTCKLTSSTD